MTIIIRTIPMPPMIHGHPDLGVPDWIFPQGGRLFIPEEMEFTDQDDDDFEYDFTMSLMLPVGTPYWPREMRDWMLENDPAWTTSMRPAFVRKVLALSRECDRVESMKTYSSSESYRYSSSS